MKTGLLFTLLATSPNPGAGPLKPEPGPPPPMIMRGKDGGGIGSRGPTRIAVDEKGTVLELLTALRAHVEPLRGEATTCWVRLGQWVMHHPQVELVIAGTRFPGTVTCSGDQIDKWTKERAQYVRLAVSGPDMKSLAVFHKYGAPGVAYKKEVGTVYGGSGGPAKTLLDLHLKFEGKEVTVIGLTFGS